MEKRKFVRKPCHLDAAIISGDKIYDGYIGNISEEGLEYLMTAYVQSPRDFTPERILQLNFPVSVKETVNLTCEAIWFLRAVSLDQTLIGMKIINPPQKYRELIRKGNMGRFLSV